MFDNYCLPLLFHFPIQSPDPVTFRSAGSLHTMPLYFSRPFPPLFAALATRSPASRLTFHRVPLSRFLSSRAALSSPPVLPLTYSLSNLFLALQYSFHTPPLSPYLHPLSSPCSRNRITSLPTLFTARHFSSHPGSPPPSFLHSSHPATQHPRGPVPSQHLILSPVFSPPPSSAPAESAINCISNSLAESVIFPENPP